MATSRISLDQSQYVRVNFGLNPLIIEANEGEIRVAVTENQPAVSNVAYHRVTDRNRLIIESPDTNVWVLATSGAQKAVVTETPKAYTFDPSGNKSRNTVTQEQLVAQRTDNINVQFQYNVPIDEDSSDIDGATTGTGSITHENSMAVVSSGAGVGSAYIESKDSIRYFPGHEFAAEMTAYNLPDAIGGEPNTYARWGVGDVNGTGDAVCFSVINGEFGISFRSSGVEQFIPQSSFNLDKLDGTGLSGFDVNSDNLNLFTIRGGWYGVLPITFGIFGTDFGYITCHVIDRTNTTSQPHLSNPTLPMFIEVGRTSGTGSNIQVKSASWRGGICGVKPEATRADRTQIETIIEKTILGGSVDRPVISLRNNATFQGKTNHVRIRYGTVSLYTEGNKPVIWKVFKNGTLTGEVWVAKNPTTSVADYDVSATSYTPSGDPIGGIVMGKVDTARVNLFQGDVILAAYPGETITFTAASSSGTDVSLFFRWIEEF